MVPGCRLPLSCAKHRWRGDGAPEGRMSRDVVLEPEENPTIPAQQESAHYEDMQSAARFPLHLPVSLRSQGGAFAAETQNISANGVLFAMDNDVPVGSMVDF